MAAQACIQNLVWRQFGECDDTLLPTFGVNMLLARPVTPLAARVLNRSVGTYIRLTVGIPKELKCDIRVACAAGITTQVLWMATCSALRSRLAGN
jgi:hypothetical protein